MEEIVDGDALVFCKICGSANGTRGIPRHFEVVILHIELHFRGEIYRDYTCHNFGETGHLAQFFSVFAEDNSCLLRAEHHISRTRNSWSVKRIWSVLVINKFTTEVLRNIAIFSLFPLTCLVKLFLIQRLHSKQIFFVYPRLMVGHPGIFPLRRAAITVIQIVVFLVVGSCVVVDL